MKLWSNLVPGLNLAALAEGQALAQSTGLNLQATPQMLMQSAGASHVMHSREKNVLSGALSPQTCLSRHRRNTGIIPEQPGRSKLQLPLAECHDRLLARVDAAGFSNADNSAIAAVHQVPADLNSAEF